MRIGILVAIMAVSMGCSDGEPIAMDAGVDGARMGGALGDDCSSADACESGHCVDGVCCDAACDGACAACGSSGICGAAAAATECRAANGACDLAETCDGVSLTCPPDVVVTTEMVCRPSAGTCDIEEVCDGTSAACPADATAEEGTVCREAGEGTCDAAEVCSGATAVCPDDQPASEGTPCGNYLCSGSSLACPASCTSHADCASGAVCADSVCIAAKWAFVTAGSFLGGLGGLAGADSVCQASAAVGGLPGTYRAWLADSTGSPSTRFTRSSVPYVMPAGPMALVLANNYTDLTDGTLTRNFNQNESGGTVTSGLAYTNVFFNGSHISSLQSCLGWTSSSVNDTGGLGTVSSATSSWTNSGGSSCNAARRLFCFEQ